MGSKTSTNRRTVLFPAPVMPIILEGYEHGWMKKKLNHSHNDQVIRLGIVKEYILGLDIKFVVGTFMARHRCGRWRRHHWECRRLAKERWVLAVAEGDLY
jgi:hypothetical protein